MLPNHRLTSCLPLSYIRVMTLKRYARLLGRRGGVKRAKTLSPQRRKAIATSGGLARAESLQAAKRIEENFAYLEAIRQLQSEA